MRGAPIRPTRRSAFPARGGIALAIAFELGLPVKLIGVGERLDDLRPFDPRDYARALVAG
jgi:fused signal recognition particle receptor